MNLRYTLVRERSQTQNLTQCKIPFMWHSRKPRTVGTRKQIIGCQEVGRKKGFTAELCGWQKQSTSWLMWWLHDFVHLSKLFTLLLKKDKFYSVWIIPRKPDFKIRRMSSFSIPKDTLVLSKGHWLLTWPDEELLGTVLGQDRLTTPELTNPSPAMKRCSRKSTPHFWDILVKRLDPNLIRSPIRTTSSQEVPRAKEHINCHHRDIITKIQYVGNSTGQTTQLL